jgi:TrmH family RNA methyltransferase
VKLIASRDNPRFKALRDLAGDVREQRRQGMTLIDGPHLVEAYRRRVGSALLLAVSESGLANAEIQALLQSHDGEALCFRDALFRELSATVSPVGILAAIPIPGESADPLQGDCAMLDGIQDAGNVGSILRSAAAAGIVDVILGPGCAGVWTPKVLRAAQGAHFGLRLRECDDLAVAVKNFPGQTLATVVNARDSIFGIDLSGRVAWLFGSEGRGLSEALVCLSARRVTIPLVEGNESLNVAAAAAVCFFEALRQKRGE